MKKNGRNGEQDVSITDQVFQLESYSKRLLEGIMGSLLAAGVLYAVMFVLELLSLLGVEENGSFLEKMLFNVWICGGFFVLCVIIEFPRRPKRSRHPEQLRFEGGELRFRLDGKDVELTDSSILGVNQHYTYYRSLRWLPVYDVHTAEKVYQIDLAWYGRSNDAVNWLLHCNRERNTEKVRRWEAAEQAFRTSDRVVFGTKRQRIVFEQHPPSITLGNKQLDLSAITRIVIDPTVGGRGPTSTRISFMQHNGKEKIISSLPCRSVKDEWDSFLQHLFAIAKLVNVPVELKTEEQWDVSQVPSWLVHND